MKASFHSATARHEGTTLPFVIPSEVEGSAGQRTFRGSFFDRAYRFSYFATARNLPRMRLSEKSRTALPTRSR
jgi:hypothetical protein